SQVGLRRRRWVQEREWIRIALEHVEARHRRREILDAEQRARRQAGGNRIGVGAAHERAQALLRDEHSAGGEQAPLEQVAPGYLPLRPRLEDLPAALGALLGKKKGHGRSPFRLPAIETAPRER